MWNDEELERRVDRLIAEFMKRHPDQEPPSRRSARVIIRRALEIRAEQGDTLPNFVKTRRL